MPNKHLANRQRTYYHNRHNFASECQIPMKDNSTNRVKNNAASNLSTDEKYAVALGYDQAKDNAPKVLAKGQGEIADKIIEIAQANNIEIRSDADLLQILKAVDINQEIPLEAFAAVAEIISYIYQQNGKM